MLLQILDTEATFCVGVGWSSCSSMGQAISVVCAAAFRFRGATKPTLQYASTHRFGLLVSRHSVQRDDWQIISKHFINLKKLYTTETVSSAFSLITKLDVCVCVVFGTCAALVRCFHSCSLFTIILNCTSSTATRH